jgi:hypothetical protein
VPPRPLTKTPPERVRRRSTPPSWSIPLRSALLWRPQHSLATDYKPHCQDCRKERLKEVREQEDLAAWKADAEKLEVRRMAKMTEFADFYPPMYERIVDHLYSMRALDREIDALNRRRPDHKSVRPLEYSTPAFTLDLKIPDRTKRTSLCGRRRSQTWRSR